MGTVFDILKLIEKYPGMYLGGDDTERQAQLRRLEMLLYGYDLALHQHKIREPGASLLDRLSVYLQGEFGWSMSSGAIEAILRESGNPDDAWQAFWRLLWEFRDKEEGSNGS